MTESLRVDLVVVGGGVGGVAAALAALDRGLNVALVERYDWVGGQLTVQGTPPDEHPWIEQKGATRSYRRFRDGVRQWYRESGRLNARAIADPMLNPGNATVSKLSCEPHVSEAVLRAMLHPWIERGSLVLRTGTVLVSCEIDGDRIGGLEFRAADGSAILVTALYVIDATELGDVVALASVEHRVGAEAHSETGEPHAPAVADPGNMQAFTWPFAISYDPARDATIERPASYENWRGFAPSFWPGPYLSLTYPDPRTLEPISGAVVPHQDSPDDLIVADQSRDAGSRDLWVYRRVLWRHHGAPRSSLDDVVIVNWPMTDYLGGPLIGVSDEEVALHERRAKELSLSFLYWLQTEAPRPDGGTGWAGLRLRPDVMGTVDGLAMGPYVRESRRIRAMRTVVEQDVSLAVRGAHGATRFDDTVGIGAYRIDLHPSTAGDNYIDIASLPFQIPFSALVPERVVNLLAGAKNIGTTHITNGCYRLHPVEWNIGEAAGAAVALSLSAGVPPRAIVENDGLLARLQSDLVRAGVELEWSGDVHGY